MLLNDDQYRYILDWIDDNLNFRPGVYRGHDFPMCKPFDIPARHVVYGIENMEEAHANVMDDLIGQAFLNVTKQGHRLYALDWQHSGFLFDPRSEDAYKSIYLGENPYLKGGLYACFPSFYPDGDYYFFIDEHLQFGYLSHPWRQEVWIFGDVLIKEFQSIYSQLGWDLLYEFVSDCQT